MMRAPSFIDPMNATLRESRMVLERLVQWKGVPPGMIFSVMDCGVYSAALGLSGFAGLEAQLDLLNSGAAGGIALLVEGSDLVIDAGGNHAWLVAEPALDVLLATWQTDGTDSLLLRNVTEPAELAVIAAIAEKHGVHADITAAPTGARVTLCPAEAGQQTTLDHIRRHGIAVDHDLWFHLLKLSSNGLAEDTVLSRSHTGVFMIRPDGTVLGAHEPEFAQEDKHLYTADKLEFRR